MIQDRATTRMAEKIRKFRARRKPLTLAAICLRMGILKTNGEPDTGLASLIADGFQPTRRETRSRLGLPDVCPKCLRPYPKPKEQRSTPLQRDVPEGLKWWRSLTKEEREKIILEVWGNKGFPRKEGK